MLIIIIFVLKNIKYHNNKLDNYLKITVMFYAVSKYKTRD